MSVKGEASMSGVKDISMKINGVNYEMRHYYDALGKHGLVIACRMATPKYPYFKTDYWEKYCFVIDGSQDKIKAEFVCGGCPFPCDKEMTEENGYEVGYRFSSAILCNKAISQVLYDYRFKTGFSMLDDDSREFLRFAFEESSLSEIIRYMLRLEDNIRIVKCTRPPVINLFDLKKGRLYMMPYKIGSFNIGVLKVKRPNGEYAYPSVPLDWFEISGEKAVK